MSKLKYLKWIEYGVAVIFQSVEESKKEVFDRAKIVYFRSVTQKNFTPYYAIRPAIMAAVKGDKKLYDRAMTAVGVIEAAHKLSKIRHGKFH